MNRKIKAILIDDEHHVIENMQILLGENFPNVEIIGTATKILHAITLINKLKPDVIFLDISMQEGTGFDLLEAIDSRNFKVVFVTAHQEYSINAIKQNAFDYILKPIQLAELRDCINKLENTTNKTTTISNRISISTIDTTEFINTEDIVYCKSDNSYTTIHLKTGQSLFTSKSLKNIENMLPSTFFKRSHNSYLVNRTYVKRYLKKDESIELFSGTQIPVSKSKREFFLTWLEY